MVAIRMVTPFKMKTNSYRWSLTYCGFTQEGGTLQRYTFSRNCASNRLIILRASDMCYESLPRRCTSAVSTAAAPAQPV